MHLADIRTPTFPIAFGYVQTPTTGGGVHPIIELSVIEEMGDHGFPTSARIIISTGSAAVDGGAADNLSLTVTPIAFGPVLLRNDDGRISRFPRAMVRYAADDGRAGMGWIEWNQPDPAE